MISVEPGLPVSFKSLVTVALSSVSFLFNSNKSFTSLDGILNFRASKLTLQEDGEKNMVMP